jgi:light-harvesting complex I chlorophyll a/b binding protein 1
MIAIMGLMVQDYTFGMAPLQMINKGGFYGPPVDFIVQDLGLCMGYTYCATRERTARTIMRSGYSEGYKPFQNGRYPPAPGESWDDDWGFPDPDKELEMSPSMPFLTMPKHLKGWVGGEKGFDPLGVTDALPVYWVREAELKHGRVCMLATLGWITTDLGVRFPGDMYQVSTIEAHNKLVDEGQMQPFLGAIGIAELYGLYLIIEGWGGEIDRSAGDFFLGKNFLPKDVEGEKDVKLKEIENGRLAMLAFGGIATQAVLTGKTWPFFD